MNGGTLHFLALYITSILESLNFLGLVEEERFKVYSGVRLEP